jgi:hypothetical protein
VKPARQTSRMAEADRQPSDIFCHTIRPRSQIRLQQNTWTAIF